MTEDGYRISLAAITKESIDHLNGVSPQSKIRVLARRVALTILAWQVSFTVPASGQGPETKPSVGASAGIIVYVRAPTGEPLSVPAVVLLFKSDGTPCGRATTQGNAPIVFPNLAPGQWGNIIVLSADLTKLPPREILRTQVLRTCVGGRRVYQKQ